MSIENIWNYYKEVADKETKWKDPEHKKGPDSFSLVFFYSEGSTAARQNELVRAFLKDPLLHRDNAPVNNISADDIAPYVSSVTPPYEAQITAVCNALNYPLSIVQGPPGTGKTEMILNLLAVIRRLYPQKTVALVSSNMEAVKNIYDKIIEASSEEKYDPVFAELYGCFAVLGKLELRKEWYKTMKERGADSDGLFDGNKFSPKLLEQFPIFTSTINSVRKIFTSSGDFRNQFDFVIMDEASQTNIMRGIIAMSCAKQMVVIGDDKQLAPIVKEEAIETGCLEEYAGVDEIYKETESFLSACGSIFGDSIRSVFLNRHYRCLPSIIGFCNEYVYNNALDIRSREEGFHIRAVWYDGDYCEKYTAEDRSRKIYNMRQIKIFTEEELPRVSRLIQQNENLSVMVVAPFKEQIERLKEALERKHISCDENDPDGENEALINNRIYSLTIHRSQGKGFDIVYMLTTEDYRTEGDTPWCQEMRMMNVAVSRAKKEFCIVTSSQWLPREIWKSSANYISTEPPYDLSDPENMFFCKLLEYVGNKCPQPVGDYGFHRSGIRSVFDRVPYYRKKYDTGNNCRYSNSAPARLAFEMLEDIVSGFPDEDNYRVLREVPLSFFRLQNGTISCDGTELLEFAKRSAADFVVCKGEQVRLILEVDGGHHRNENSVQKKCDRNKDVWIREILASDSIYLRLPTDGTSENEEITVKEIIESSENSNIKIEINQIKEMCFTMEKKDIIKTLNNRVNTAFTDLKEEIRNAVDPQCSDPDKVDLSVDNEEKRSRLADMDIFKALVTKNNYSDALNASYTEKPYIDYYLCRYGIAYAFEYALMYDIVMRSFIKNGGNDQLGVFSFGCGNMVDALSMLYAKKRLCLEDGCYANCKLYYKGIDIEAWKGAPFVYQNNYEGNEDPCQSSSDAALRSEFEKIFFFKEDINEFLYKRFIENSKAGVYHNVIFFPKILNELPDDVISKMCDLFAEMNFDRLDEYYICVSHSPTHVFKNQFNNYEGANIIDKIISNINSKNEFEVCSNIKEMLGDDQWNRFKEKWQGKDEIIDIANEAYWNNAASEMSSYITSVTSPPNHSCYLFRSAIYRKAYQYPEFIDNLNKDFCKNDDISNYFKNKLENVLIAAYEKMKENGRYISSPHVSPISSVSRMLFQVIRLKRKKSSL